ncbi:hypothetical protein BMS3Abin10_01884 [bacterium BMS3Abin10]|nr:hypothetical protein BMS3Abin10_01884 [bacterium BMS3Abin10]GBE40000.1 hypothetical protein BMS3Bbin08_02636 [bacterium BMS3Bbin08]
MKVKLYFLAILFLLIPIAAEAEDWVRYAEPSVGTEIYYDSESIEQMSNKIIRVWLKTEKSIDLYTDLSRTYLKTRKILQEINCSNRKTRVITINDYHTNGTEDSTSYDDLRWNYAGPGTDMKRLYDMVCSDYRL